MSSKNGPGGRQTDGRPGRGPDDLSERLPEWAPVERIAYDRSAGHYRLRYDDDGSVPIGGTVALAVAAVGDLSPEEGRPLTDAIDVDALNQLFEPPRTEVGEREIEVQFRYRDCTVSVTEEGWIMIAPDWETS
jgi:hypothetical protein